MNSRTIYKLGVICIGGLLGLAGCQPSYTSHPITGDKPSTPRATAAAIDGGTTRWLSLDYPPGIANTSVIRIEKAIPTEVRVHQPFTYELKATNLSDQMIHDIVISERISKNLQVNKSIPEGQVDPQGLLTWPLGSLDPKESRTVTVTAVATDSGAVSGCASVSYNALLCANISVVKPQLKMTKTGPDQVLRCDEIVYQFNVINEGTGSVHDVQVSDPLPTGLTTKDGLESIQLRVGTLAPGQSRQFKETVKASKTGSFSTKAAVVGEGGLSASSDEVVTVVREPVLEITQTGPSEKYIGRTAIYVTTVTNIGDGVAEDTVIVTTVPPGVTVAAISEGGRFVDGEIRWKMGPLLPNASTKVALTLSANQAGVLQMKTGATAHCASGVSATSQTIYTGIPAILMEVVDVDDPIETGQNATYVITVTNQGSAADTNVRVTCTLEDNFEYASSSGPTKGQLQGRTLSFAPVASLAPGDKAQWRVVVKATKAGDVRSK